jgi:hypothetical protein
MHRKDVRVLQARGEPNFALKSLRAERHGQVRVQNLERDRAVVSEVVR